MRRAAIGLVVVGGRRESWEGNEATMNERTKRGDQFEAEEEGREVERETKRLTASGETETVTRAGVVASGMSRETRRVGEEEEVRTVKSRIG